MSFTSLKSESNHGKDKGNFITAANSPASFTDDRPLVEECGSRPRLAIPLQSASPRSSDSLSAVSTYSVDDEDERRINPEPNGSGSRLLISEVPTKAWKINWQRIWGHNRGIALVIISQFFGALMNLATRLLETEGDGHEMHTFQVCIGFLHLWNG